MSHRDPTDLQYEDDSRADAENKAALAAEAEKADVQWLMGNAQGRRIVWRSLKRAGIYRCSFRTDALAMAFEEGRRNEGLKLLDQISTLCPEQYLTMIKEHADVH